MSECPLKVKCNGCMLRRGPAKRDVVSSARWPEVKGLQKQRLALAEPGPAAVQSQIVHRAPTLLPAQVEAFFVLQHHRLIRLVGVLALLAVVETRPAVAGESAPLAPSFTVRALDGRSVRLSDYKGKAVVLDFWATWCAPCRASLPHLDEVQGRFSKQGLVVLGLSVDDAEPQTVRRFADKLGLKFRMAMADERVLDLYGPIRTIPTTFFINRRGEVTRRVVGYIDSETLEGYVRELF